MYRVVSGDAGLLFCSFNSSAPKPTPPLLRRRIEPARTLPSEATVNEFLKHMFGWNQNLAWHVVSIKPSEAPTISEVTVVFNTPEGQRRQRIYVTPDESYAFSGDLVPFGADPFAEARAELKNVTGLNAVPRMPQSPSSNSAIWNVRPARRRRRTSIKLMSEEPKAKLIFQNFPLEQIHKWAMPAAKYLDCLGREQRCGVEVHRHHLRPPEARSTSRMSNRC